MNRKTYRQIAKKHGVSLDEVKREMQTAINSAYVFPNDKALNIPRKKEIPTVGEFIEYSVNQIIDDES